MFRKGLMATAALVALLAMPINAPSAHTVRSVFGNHGSVMLDTAAP